MHLNRCTVLLLLLLQQFTAVAQRQDNIAEKVFSFPDKLFRKLNNKVDHKIDQLDQQLTRQTERYLKKLANQERRLQKKISKIDSSVAKNLFANSEQAYDRFIKGMISNSSSTGGGRGEASGEYQPYTDSLKTVLSFLDKNKELLNASKGLTNKLQHSHTAFNQLQGKLKTTEDIKIFIRNRQQLLHQTISRYKNLPTGITRGFQNYQQQFYAYNLQIQEYKDLLNDPSKWERKALELLNQLPAFRDFARQYSQLAGLFSLPAGQQSAQSVAGLQTRVQTQALIQNQLASAGPNAQAMLQSQLTAAQAQLNSFKDKITKLGSGSGDLDMPDFKPKNQQKAKTFWKRLEYGANLQTTKSGMFFPNRTELAASVGYKLDDKKTIGLAIGYTAGWGKDIRHIKITHQGINFRAFVDLKIKSSFYASGGFEYYQDKPFAAIQQLYNLSTWHQSGLIGVSKIISLKTKLFKKTKASLLWDALSYRQIPRTQALKFRIGYAF